MLKIVIADDEFPSRQELRALLETNSNLEIIAECEHGEAVLDYFSNNTADAVFLDIEMPVLDGLAVGEKLKTLPNPPKIIFSTGFDHSGGKTGALIADDHRHADSHQHGRNRQRLSECRQPVQKSPHSNLLRSL